MFSSEDPASGVLLRQLCGEDSVSPPHVAFVNNYLSAMLGVGQYYSGQCLVRALVVFTLLTIFVCAILVQM